jgi:hypothetical protein
MHLERQIRSTRLLRRKSLIQLMMSVLGSRFFQRGEIDNLSSGTHGAAPEDNLSKGSFEWLVVAVINSTSSKSFGGRGRMAPAVL